MAVSSSAYVRVRAMLWPRAVSARRSSRLLRIASAPTSRAGSTMSENPNSSLRWKVTNQRYAPTAKGGRHAARPFPMTPGLADDGHGAEQPLAAGEIEVSRPGAERADRQVGPGGLGQLVPVAGAQVHYVAQVAHGGDADGAQRIRVGRTIEE